MTGNTREFPGHIRRNCYDAAVIGAGPAGSLTAALLAGAGLAVLLLDKQELPREKICGGLVSARALSLLPRDLPLPAETGNPIRSILVYSRGRSYRCRAETILGTAVRRARFDHILARYAQSRGARLLEKTPLLGLAEQRCGPGEKELVYRLDSSGGPYFARFVVGADGARGGCACLAGLKRQAVVKPTGWGCAAIFPGQAGEQEQDAAAFYPLPLRGGLGWSFPGRGWVNRGVGGLAKPGTLIKEFRRLFPSAPEEITLKVWPIPFTGPLRRVARRNLVLVGDAAGLVDPFSGEGLYNAFNSASLAAHSILAAAEANEPLAGIYSPLFHRYFKRSFLSSLIGAIALHARFVASPAALPRPIAAIMQNRYWFNRDLPELSLKTTFE